MTNLEIERWALASVDHVRKKLPIEDSQVELKSEWIEPKKAARRLAGHANAARGEPILWVIGLDETRGVMGATADDLAKWWPAVKAEFDEMAPALTVNLVVPVDGKAVVALLFETDRFPYVVKNPAGGAIQFEIPWRDGTTTRTAKRSDLVRLVAPLQQMPDFEILKGFLRANIVATDTLGWYLELPLYLASKSDQDVIPFHRCKAGFEIPGLFPHTEFERLFLAPAPSPQQQGIVPSLTVTGSTTEVIVKRAGMVKLTCYGKSRMPATREVVKAQAPTVLVMLKLITSHADVPAVITESFTEMTQAQGQWGLWKN